MKFEAVFRYLRSGLTGLVFMLAMGHSLAALSEPLRIGYSDWPGWDAWQIAIDKGWFKQAGVDVQFSWFDYVPSMDAYAAGKLDAVAMTNGDALVTGATGGKSVMILVNDFSAGNDMIVAQPGIENLKQLKGKKIGVELGYVDHLLLLKGLEKYGMSEKDVQLVNVPTNETPQVLASGQVSAIGAWQPSSGKALELVPGSKPIFTSAQEPGLIYDTLAVNPASLAAHPEEWKKVVKVWYRVVNYIKNPKTRDDAIKIMASRVGISPAEFKPLLKGTHILTLKEAKKVLKKGPGLNSIYGSTKIVNHFNLKYDVYKKSQDVDSYIDPSITEAMH